MIKFFLKEASLLSAFIILGALLLLSFWVAYNVQTGVAKEFANPTVSVVLHDRKEDDFRMWLQKQKGIINFEFFSSDRNKKRLGEIYPELRNLIAPLDLKFFPASATVVTANADLFLNSLQDISSLVSSKTLHEPPLVLQKFVKMISGMLLALWLMTLALVLYFNLERITVRDHSKWSLMKMLGAKSETIFLSLWYGQALRVGIACFAAIFLAYGISGQIEKQVPWNWSFLPLPVWVGFFMLSIFLTFVFAYGLFRNKYQKVSLG